MCTAPRSPGLAPFDGSSSRAQVSGSPPEDAPVKMACKKALQARVDELDRLQRMFHAHDRHGVLLVFRGMDAAATAGEWITAMEAV